MQRPELVAALEQDDRYFDAIHVDLAGLQLAFDELVGARSDPKLVGLWVERGPVDDYAESVDQLTAQPRAAGHGHPPERRERDADAAVAAPSGHQRTHVRREREAVDHGVGQADLPGLTDEVRPVGGPGHGGRKRAGDAEPDRRVGRALEPEQVEEERARPGADRDVGEHRVERVTQPGAVQERLEAPRRLAAGREHGVDRVLERLGQRLEQPFGLLYAARERLLECVEGVNCHHRFSTCNCSSTSTTPGTPAATASAFSASTMSGTVPRSRAMPSTTSTSIASAVVAASWRSSARIASA